MGRMINEGEAFNVAMNEFASIAAEQAIRKELKDKTLDLVKKMREDGRTKEWGEGYMEGVTAGLIPQVRVEAKEHFEKAWATTE